MSQNVHTCILPYTDTSGFPKLPPNAPTWTRMRRSLRKFLAMDPNNSHCKFFFRNKSTLIAEQKRHARSPYVFVIHPFSKFAALMEAVFCFAWLYSIILNPIMHCLPEKNVTIYQISTCFVIPIKATLILLFFCLGYVDHKTKQIIIGPKMIATHYLRRYFFFDFIASEIPWGVISYFFENPRTHLPDPFDVLFVIVEYLCLYARVCSVLGLLNGMGQILKLPRELRFVINHVSKSLLIIHLLGCLLFTIPMATYEADVVPKASWLAQAKIHDDSRRVIHIYTECLLLAACYFFGASHGMYTVSEPIEEVCLSMVTLFGRLYTLFLLADVLRMFGIASVSESRYEQRVTQLEEYIRSKKLPQNMRNRLLKYYECKLQKHYFNEREIASTLSEHLRTELFLFAARKLIQKASVFKVLPRSTLGVIVALMKAETFSPNDVILSIGSIVDDIYFISSGTVAVVNKEGVKMLYLEDGDEFGITVIGNRQRYLHIAVEPTEVFYMNKLLFLDYIQTHTEGLRTFENTVKKRLAKYLYIEETAKRGGDDFLSELQNGNILERLIKRPKAEA